MEIQFLKLTLRTHVSFHFITRLNTCYVLVKFTGGTKYNIRIIKRMRKRLRIIILITNAFKIHCWLIM